MIGCFIKNVKLRFYRGLSRVCRQRFSEWFNGPQVSSCCPPPRSRVGRQCMRVQTRRGRSGGDQEAVNKPDPLPSINRKIPRLCLYLSQVLRPRKGMKRHLFTSWSLAEVRDGDKSSDSAHTTEAGAGRRVGRRPLDVLTVLVRT